MIGNKLKELRTQKGYTIVQLCKELEMNQNTYAKYERNERDVSTDTLSQLANFYEVSTDYLLGRTPVKQMTTEEPDVLSQLAKIFNLSEFEKVLVQAFIAISPEERGKFIETIAKYTQKEEILQKPHELPIVQSAQQSPPQPVKPPIVQQSKPVLTQQPTQTQIEPEQPRPWRMAARSADGRYTTRTLTPEEVELIDSLEDVPKSRY